MWTDKDREKYKADDRRYPSDPTDAEWKVIEPWDRQKIGGAVLGRV